VIRLSKHGGSTGGFLFPGWDKLPPQIELSEYARCKLWLDFAMIGPFVH